MIDPDLLDSNPIAREGIKLLAASGVLNAQLDRLKVRMAFGDADEADDSLLKAIKEFRKQYGIIESLRSLGEGYSKETEE